MESGPREIYEFGAFRLDADERILSGGSGAIPLPPKVFDTLLLLVANSGRVLSKEKIYRDGSEIRLPVYRAGRRITR